MICDADWYGDYYGQWWSCAYDAYYEDDDEDEDIWMMMMKMRIRIRVSNKMSKRMRIRILLWDQRFTKCQF